MRYRLLGDLNVGDRFRFTGSRVLDGKVDAKYKDSVEVLIDPAPPRRRPERQEWHRSTRVQKL